MSLERSRSEWQPAGPRAGEDQRTRVLLVDDDRMSTMALAAMLTAQGCAVETAPNGAEAYVMLRAMPDRADIVVTDRFMPVMDGLALTRRLRREAATARLPIVMLTGASDHESVAEGIAAGVFQYLNKPVVPHLMQEVIRAAEHQVEQQRETSTMLRRHQSGFANIQRMDLTLRTTAEIDPVASLLASLTRIPERAMAGLRELLCNGIEHGLYRIGGEAKATLSSENRLQEELDQRSANGGYPGTVEAAAQRLADGVRYLVRDPGPGFVWRRHLLMDSSRSVTSTGRGLARAALIFDTLEFNEAGNIVAGTLRDERKTKW